MKMPDYKMIGIRIKARRDHLKRSQEKVAADGGIGVQHLSKIENGSTKLSLPCLIALANALDTTVDLLLMDSVSVSKAEVVMDSESLFADCTFAETFVLREQLIILKKNLREKGLSDKDREL